MSTPLMSTDPSTSPPLVRRSALKMRTMANRVDPNAVIPMATWRGSWEYQTLALDARGNRSLDMDGERLYRGSCVVGSIKRFRAGSRSAWPAAFTLRQAVVITPLPSIRNVERMIPSYSFP